MIEEPQPADQADPEALGDLLRRYAHAVHRVNLAMARALAMPPTDVWALEHLLSTGALGPVELGNRLSIRSASATALVDRLEQAGHVQRRRHDTDRRRIVIEPTADGEAAAYATFAPLGDALDAAAEDFTAAERAAIARYLQRVTAALESYSATHPL